MEDGFVKAESTNLPMINTLMVVKFFAFNPDFCSAELRNIKTAMSGRESYGDDAIGYVQLKRVQNTCIVKCTVWPEHKVRSEPYGVTFIVNEQEETVTSVKCHDCPSSEGGCKHSVAFLMWLHRRTEAASCTSVECYWRKSNLAKSFAKALRRPAFLPVPEAILNFLLNSERAMIMTKGQRVKPKKVLELGFKYQYEDIDQACQEFAHILPKRHPLK